jgi:hypothetical protein
MSTDDRLRFLSRNAVAALTEINKTDAGSDAAKTAANSWAVSQILLREYFYSQPTFKTDVTPSWVVVETKYVALRFVILSVKPDSLSHHKAQASEAQGHNCTRG